MKVTRDAAPPLSPVACVSMFHRFSTWWRALSVVLLGLATLTWPSAAQAQTTPAFSVISQDAVASISSSGSSTFHLDVSVPHGTTNGVALSLYPQMVYRSEVTAIIDGAGPTTSPVALTTVTSPTCVSGSTLSLSVSLFNALGTGASHGCGAQPVHLRLPCQGAACDGVYPLSIAVTVDNVRHLEWSMIAVHALSVLHPLLVDFMPVVDPTAWASASLAQSNFKVIARYGSLPLTMAIDYRPLSSAVLSSSSRAWRNSLSSALASTDHRAIVAPPANADLAGLAANGFAGEVTNQINLDRQLLHTVTGRYPDGPVYFSSPTSSGALIALAHAGVSEAVLPDNAFNETPSTTLGWGAPFHLTGVTNVTALATDGGLTQLAADAAIEPGRRAALTLATLAFLHFEAPNAPAERTVIVPLNTGSLSPTYLDDLLGPSQSNPFIAPSTLTPSFDPSLIASDNSPSERTLTTVPYWSWSSTNVATLDTLISRTNSFLQAIAASPTQSWALQTYLARAEQTGDSVARQSALDLVSTYLNNQLSGFRIDNSTIILTGSGGNLPITLFSSARYPVTVVLHLITDRLKFPKNQSTYAETLDAPTTPLRIAAIDRLGESFTLRLELTTPDGNLVLAHAAVQVRVAGTSVVGYILSGASLFVLAWWWLRTYRRKSRGRHAR